MSALATLPEELIKLIVELLPRKDLSNAALVSRTIARISMPLRCSRVHVRDSVKACPKIHGLLGRLSQGTELVRYIQHMTISAWKFAEVHEPSPAELQTLYDATRILEGTALYQDLRCELRESSTGAVIALLLAHCSRLKSMNFGITRERSEEEHDIYDETWTLTMRVIGAAAGPTLPSGEQLLGHLSTVE